MFSVMTEVEIVLLFEWKNAVEEIPASVKYNFLFGLSINKAIIFHKRECIAYKIQKMSEAPAAIRILMFCVCKHRRNQIGKKN